MSRSWFSALEKMETILRVTVILALACFIILQTIAAQEPYHFYWSFADYLEGENVSVDRSSNAGSEGTLRIELEGRACLPLPEVKINGRTAISLNRQPVQIRVKEGDLVTIDGTVCDYDLVYRVIGVSPGVAWPPINYCVRTHASTVQLGKVKID